MCDQNKKDLDQNGQMPWLIRILYNVNGHFVISGIDTMFFLYGLMLYVHGQQLRSCWDRQPIHTVPKDVPEARINRGAS